MQLELVLVGIGAMVVAAGVLAQNNRSIVIFSLLVTTLLSGAQAPLVDAAGVQARRFCILLLALLALRTRESLPTPFVALVSAALIALAGLVQHDPSVNGLSIAASLLLLHGPASKTIYSWLSAGNIRTLARMSVAVATIHIALSVSALPTLAPARRFAGIGVDVPLYAFTGAMLLAPLLWAAQYGEGRIRNLSRALIPMIVLLTLLAGQRSGVVNLAAAASPFLATGAMRRPKFAAQAGLVALAVAATIRLRASSFEFALNRYSNVDSNGRAERWVDAWQLVSQQPVTGWGAGYRENLGFGVHNSFLSLLIELGIIGLVLWLAAILWAGVQYFRAFSTARGQIDGFTQLGASWLVLSVVGAMAEDKLYRPSNLPAITLVLALAIAASLSANRPKLRSYCATSFEPDRPHLAIANQRTHQR